MCVLNASVLYRIPTSMHQPNEIVCLPGGLASRCYIASTLYCIPTSMHQPNGEGLGACAGKELIERRLKRNFTKVRRVFGDFGLFFLCTK